MPLPFPFTLSLYLLLILTLPSLDLSSYLFLSKTQFCELRARRALSQFNDVPLRTRRGLLLYNVYGDSALLVLNGMSLNSVNALLVLSRRWALASSYLLFVLLNTPSVHISHSLIFCFPIPNQMMVVES